MIWFNHNYLEYFYNGYKIQEKNFIVKVILLCDKYFNSLNFLKSIFNSFLSKSILKRY
jgi:hypothetical protein